MMLNSVDLPQPDGPIIATNSPGATLNETSSTAVSTPSGVSKRLTMSSTTRMGSAAAACGAPASMRSNGTVTAAINRFPLDHPSCAARVAVCLAHAAIAHPRPAWARTPSAKLCRWRWEPSTPIACRLSSAPPGRPPCPPAPVLPGAVDAVGPGARYDLVDLAGGEELDASPMSMACFCSRALTSR